MPKHKQAGHTTVLTKKTANIARKRLQCRSHPHMTFDRPAENGRSEPHCVSSVFPLRALAAQKMLQVLNHPRCHAAGKPAIHARRSKTNSPIS
jgi:hypothetical protein